MAEVVGVGNGSDGPTQEEEDLQLKDFSVAAIVEKLCELKNMFENVCFQLSKCWLHPHVGALVVLQRSYSHVQTWSKPCYLLHGSSFLGYLQPIAREGETSCQGE